MITGKDIKKLREEHGLTQAQLARAIFAGESTIANYEAERRSIDFDTLKNIVSVFGYNVEVKLVKKIDTAKNEQFYNEKSFYEIMSMNKEDLTDYVFITQSNEIIAKICSIQFNVLEVLDLNTIKNLLKASIKNTDNDIVYFKLKNLYPHSEVEMSFLIKDTNEYLKELCNIGKIDENVLKNTYYIDFDLYGYIENKEMESNNMRLLDKNKNDLNVSHKILMDGDWESDLYNPLFFYGQSHDLICYIEENPIVQLKY